jgi:hypothetical protein
MLFVKRRAGPLSSAHNIAISVGSWLSFASLLPCLLAAAACSARIHSKLRYSLKEVRVSSAEAYSYTPY